VLEGFRTWLRAARGVNDKCAAKHETIILFILDHIAEMTVEDVNGAVLTWKHPEVAWEAWVNFAAYCHTKDILLPVAFPSVRSDDLPQEVFDAVGAFSDVVFDRNPMDFCWCDGERADGGWTFTLEDDCFSYFIPDHVLRVITDYDYPAGAGEHEEVIRPATLLRCRSTRTRSLRSPSS
jgi:hypothetical protein